MPSTACRRGVSASPRLRRAALSARCARVAGACERFVHSVEQVVVAEGFGDTTWRVMAYEEERGI